MFPHVKLFSSGVSLHDEVDLAAKESTKRSYHIKNPEDKLQVSDEKSRVTTISKKYASEFDHEAFVDNLNFLSSKFAKLNTHESSKEAWKEHMDVENFESSEPVKEILPLSASTKEEKLVNHISSIEKLFQLRDSPRVESAKLVSNPSNVWLQNEDGNQYKDDAKLPKIRTVNGSKQIECKAKEYGDKKYNKTVHYNNTSSEKSVSHFQTFEDSFKLEQSSSGNEIESEKLNRLNSLKRRIKNLKTAVIGGNNLRNPNDYVPTIKDSSDATACDSKSTEENDDVKVSTSTSSSSIKPISPSGIMKNSFTTPKIITPLSIESNYSVSTRSNKENNDQNIKQSRQSNVTPSQPIKSPYFSAKPTTSSYQSDSLEYMLSYGASEPTKNIQWYDADAINFYKPQPGQPIQIAINVVVVNLADIDTAKMSYRMKLDMWVAWPLTESEVKSYYTNPDEWKPFIRPEPVPATISIESSEKMKFLSGRTTQVFLWRGKFVACECTQVTAVFLENLELVNFPFDCQHFHCKIGIRCDTDVPAKIVQDKVVFTTLDSIGGFNNLDGRAMKRVDFDEKACYFNVKSHMLTLKDFSLEGIECEIENTGKKIILYTLISTCTFIASF